MRRRITTHAPEPLHPGSDLLEQEPCNHPVDKAHDNAGNDHDRKVIYKVQAGEK